VIVTLVVLFIFSSPLFSTERKIHGLVTSIALAEKIDGDRHRITRDSTSAIDLNLAGLRVGSEVEIVGDFDDAAHEVRARRLHVFLQDEERVTRIASTKHGASKKMPDGWQGEIRVDGERVLISSKTVLTFEQGGTIALQQNGAVSELAIDSDPRGAQVKIDGSYVGETPLVIKTQPVGLGFSVFIQKEGYWSDYVQTFTVPGRTILKSTLLPKPPEKPRSAE
jgi:hypothetical protein